MSKHFEVVETKRPNYIHGEGSTLKQATKVAKELADEGQDIDKFEIHEYLADEIVAKYALGVDGNGAILTSKKG